MTRWFCLPAFLLAALPIALVWGLAGRPVAVPNGTAGAIPCVSYTPFRGAQTPFDPALVVAPAEIEDDLGKLAAGEAPHQRDGQRGQQKGGKAKPAGHGLEHHAITWRRPPHPSLSPRDLRGERVAKGWRVGTTRLTRSWVRGEDSVRAHHALGNPIRRALSSFGSRPIVSAFPAAKETLTRHPGQAARTRRDPGSMLLKKLDARFRGHDELTYSDLP